MEKIISLVISIAYLIFAYSIGGGELLLKYLAFLILPLAFIWFSDEIGGYTGLFPKFYRPITETSPGALIKFMGWVLLLLPVIIIIFIYY